VNDAQVLAAVFVLSPGTGKRAQRLACAIALLRAGMSRREATKAIRLRFAVPHCEAWRMVSMAFDMAGKPE
jgi:hypothetical protein